MPIISAVPLRTSSVYVVKSRVSDIFTEDMFEQIFPYVKASSVFTHDNKAFWTYSDFMAAVEWMNQHPNVVYHNFGTDSIDVFNNKLELASFFGNFHQETGDPSLEVPYPWSWPKVEKTGAVYEGFAGGALGIMEGSIAQPFLGAVPNIACERKGSPLELSETEKKVVGTGDTIITGIISSLVTINQPSFGLGKGTGNGAAFQDGLVAVSDDGTLWGDNPISEKFGPIRPSSELVKSTTDPKYASLGPYSQYGGRGAIQLSYNFNYSDCSIALFGDYRLAKYPNLITTTDRDNFLGLPFYFGFPGPNPGGNNRLPQEITSTTPPARVMAWLVCFWFWMDRNRSGRKMSCHQCMMEPNKYGITSCNLIINNQSGCTKGWAYNKVLYYRRICKIMQIDDSIVEASIVCPPNKENLQ